MSCARASRWWNLWHANEGVQLLVENEELFNPPSILASLAEDIDNISIFDKNGTVRAAWPKPSIPEFKTLDFSFRDYFVGQQRIVKAHRRDAYVPRAILSAGDLEFHIGITKPLFDKQGTHIGILSAGTKARSTFGAVQMNCGNNGSCMTALLGPRDRDKAGDPLPTSLNVLASPGLSEGQDLALPPGLSKQICVHLRCEPAQWNQFGRPEHSPIVIDDYEDPVSHTHSIAALAPVGRTGLVVVVATPHDAADFLNRKMTERMKAFLWVPFVLGLMVLAALVAGTLVRERWPRRNG
jgi:hypothetical protein